MWNRSHGYVSTSACMNNIHLPSIVLILYDVLLTSGQEYMYIWRSPRSCFPRILYVWNRYMFLLNVVLSLGTIPSMSDPVSVNVFLRALD